VAELVKQREAAVVGIDAARIDGDSAGIGGPHEESAGYKGLVGKVFQKIHAHPLNMCLVATIDRRQMWCRA